MKVGACCAVALSTVRGPPAQQGITSAGGAVRGGRAAGVTPRPRVGVCSEASTMCPTESAAGLARVAVPLPRRDQTLPAGAARIRHPGRRARTESDREAFSRSNVPIHYCCPTCNTRLRPLLVAPSHLKYYRNPHLSQVWYEAERVLREARRVVFVGYSLPDDDVEVVYLLKRTLARPNPPKIVVVEYDRNNPNVPITEHAAGRRYRTLFGNGIEWHACGLDDWLHKADFPPAI